MALHLYVGKEYEFEDGSTDIVTKESIFTRLVPEIYLHSRREAFKAIQEGLTLTTTSTIKRLGLGFALGLSFLITI